MSLERASINCYACYKSLREKTRFYYQDKALQALEEARRYNKQFNIISSDIANEKIRQLMIACLKCKRKNKKIYEHYTTN